VEFLACLVSIIGMTLLIRWIDRTAERQRQGSQGSTAPSLRPEPPRREPVLAGLERIARRLQGAQVEGLIAAGKRRRRQVELAVVDGLDTLRTSVSCKAPSISFHVLGSRLHAGRFVIRQVGYGVGSSADVARAALDNDRVRRALSRIFAKGGAREVLLADGFVRSFAPLDERDLTPSQALGNMERLEDLARALEALDQTTRVRATAVIDPAARQCPYCRDLLASEEHLALVACRRCKTVLHEECFDELRRCPAMGCGSRRRDPVEAAPADVRQPSQIEIAPCERCGMTERGCTPDACQATERERILYARHRAVRRRAAREAQQDDANAFGDDFYTQRKTWRYRKHT
jgi:hypothetical protein